MIRRGVPDGVPTAPAAAANLEGPPEGAGPAGWRVHVALAAAQVMFGAFSVIGKLALREVPPLALAACRALAAAAVFQLWMSARGREPLTGRGDIPRLALYAMLGIVINQVCFLSGLARTTAINATLLIATIPIFTYLAAVALRRESWRPLRGAGVALSFAGAVLLVGADAVLFDRGYLGGNLLIVINSASYGLYLVLSRTLLARYSAATVIGWAFTFGAAVLLPFALPQLLRVPWGSLSTGAWLAIAYTLIFPTAIAYLLAAWALARSPASLVAAYVNFQPLVAVSLAVVVLDETVGWWAVASGVLVLAGVSLTSRHGA